MVLVKSMKTWFGESGVGGVLGCSLRFTCTTEEEDPRYSVWNSKEARFNCHVSTAAGRLLASQHG